MEGAERVPGEGSGVLYLETSGAPAPDGLPSLVILLQEAGGRVAVFQTPMGQGSPTCRRTGAAYGEPVRWEYRMPGTGSRMLLADAVPACPLTFNSVNKFVHGHADNFAVGLLCEMAGVRGAGGRRPALQAAAGVASSLRGEPGHAARHGGPVCCSIRRRRMSRGCHHGLRSRRRCPPPPRGSDAVSPGGDVAGARIARARRRRGRRSRCLPGWSAGQSRGCRRLSGGSGLWTAIGADPRE